MTQRKNWIDGLRGLAMLFVIYGHLCTGIRPYSLFSSPIKLPLFFAVTGYVFSFKDGDIKTFFRGLLRHLVLPWLVFSAAYTVVKIVTGTSAAEALLDFACGKVAWYIPCLIVAEIIFFFIQKASKRRPVQYALIFAVSVAGFFLSKLRTPFWTFVSRSMIVQFYLLIGFVFRHLDGRIGKAKLWPAVFGLMYALVGAYVLVAYKSSMMDVQSNNYYDALPCAAMIIGGCCFLFYYARFVPTPKWLIFIGRNTLIFYLFHARILDMMQPLIRLIPHSLRSNVLTGLPISLVICALLCALCAVCSVFINRYIPFLAGRSKKAR